MAIAVNRWLLSAIAALLAGVAIAPSAGAVDVYKDSAGAVYLSGLQPKKVVNLQYENLPITKQFGTDTCGVLTFTTKQLYANDYKVIDATGIETTFSGNGAKTEVAYRCKGGQTPTTDGWQPLGNGLTLATKPNTLRSVFYIAGLSPYKQIKLMGLDAYQERSLTANTCGIVKLTSSQKYPLQRFYYYQSGIFPQGPFDVLSLGTRSTPDLCRNGVFYKPCEINCDQAGSGYAGEPYTGGSGKNGDSISTGGSGGSVTYPEFFVANNDLYYRGIPRTTYTVFDGEVWRSTTADTRGYTNLKFWGYNVALYRVSGQGNQLVKQTPGFGSAPNKPVPVCSP